MAKEKVTQIAPLEREALRDVVRAEREYLAGEGWTPEQIRLLEANAPGPEELRALRSHNAKLSAGLRQLQRAIADGERFLSTMQAPAVSVWNVDGTRAKGSDQGAPVNLFNSVERDLVKLIAFLKRIAEDDYPRRAEAGSLDAAKADPGQCSRVGAVVGSSYDVMRLQSIAQGVSWGRSVPVRRRDVRRKRLQGPQAHARAASSELGRGAALDVGRGLLERG